MLFLVCSGLSDSALPLDRLSRRFCSCPRLDDCWTPSTASALCFPLRCSSAAFFIFVANGNQAIYYLQVLAQCRVEFPDIAVVGQARVVWHGY